MEQPLKIVFTGPESSGKSELCHALCKKYKLPYYGEYARIYLEQNGPKYGLREFQEIYRGHIALQRKAVSASREVALLDTDSINFKVWAQRVFGKVPQIIEEQMLSESDHLYLLTYPDLPWQPDPLRENPTDRMQIFEEHKALIDKLKRPYQIITGTGINRLENTRKAIEKFKSDASL